MVKVINSEIYNKFISQCHIDLDYAQESIGIYCDTDAERYEFQQVLNEANIDLTDRIFEYPDCGFVISIDKLVFVFEKNQYKFLYPFSDIFEIVKQTG